MLGNNICYFATARCESFSTRASPTPTTTTSVPDHKHCNVLNDPQRYSIGVKDIYRSQVLRTTARQSVQIL